MRSNWFVRRQPRVHPRRHLISKALKIPLTPVIRSSNSVLDITNDVLKYGQDWRDFNVHCAIVNMFLVEDIHAKYSNKNVVVLTGDLMNEYLCDYNEELVDGTVYYKQMKGLYTQSHD